MPLLAYSEMGEPLVASLLSDAECEGLRSAKDRDAWMPQSRKRAVPRVSRLGTRFFAHPPGHAPEGARETRLNLYLKAQCLIGAGSRAALPSSLRVDLLEAAQSVAATGWASPAQRPRRVGPSREDRQTVLIPSLVDQNPWAQSRRPRDMMRQGWSVSLFQAAQQ
jgi:hypothetical protein